MEENKQKYELTKFEHELLVFLQTEGYNYIAKDSSGEFAPPRLVACDKKLPYHNLSGMFTTYKSNAFHIEGPFGKLFKFVWGGNQFEIQELLENCEVTDHDSTRKVVALNTRTNDPLFTVEGKISLDSDEDGDLNVTIKTGKGKYKLFYAHLSNDVTYTCIQTEAKKENPYAYDIQFFPAKEVIENGIIDIKSSE